MSNLKVMHSCWDVRVTLDMYKAGGNYDMLATKLSSDSESATYYSTFGHDLGFP